MKRRWEALRSVRPSQIPLLITVTGLAIAVPLLARLSPTRLDSWLDPRGQRPVRRDRWAAIPHLVDVCIAAFQPIVRPGCLTRGITSYALLRRAGLDVSLVFGMGRTDDRDEGHCWLSRDGVPWLEKVDPHDHFVAMTSFPGAREVVTG